MSDAEPHDPADGGRGQPPDAVAGRAGAAGGAGRADRGRQGIATGPLLYLERRCRRATGARRPGRGGGARRGRVAAGRRLRRLLGAQGLLPALDRRAGALLPLRAALGPALPAPEPPEAGPCRWRPRDRRRLQHLRRLFRHDRGGRLARSRPRRSRARPPIIWCAISTPCSTGRRRRTRRSGGSGGC